MDRPRPIRALGTLFGGMWEALQDGKVQLLLGLTASIISVATVFYHFVEGWSWIDAAYFSTVTIATVGYGDFVPQTVQGKLFTIAYVLFGIGIFVAACTALTEHLIRKARENEKARRRHERAMAIRRAHGQQSFRKP
jgi:voltage-gated potassium channel Kch